MTRNNILTDNQDVFIVAYILEDLKMKLRNYRNSDREYNIGIDAGTASVGWAVIDDESGDLCYFKNKPTWGSRLFTEADFASTARGPRGQRRRYDRRRQRLNLLQNFFKDEIEKVDPEFFFRLNNSFRVKEERNFDNPLFNGTDFTEREYYGNFKTIYHLRDHLVKSDDKEDIRLIYLALHNIVKARGNFLYQDNPKLSAKNANMREVVENLKTCLIDYMDYLFGEGMYPEPNFDVNEVISLFENRKFRGLEREKKLIDAFGFNTKKFEDLGKESGFTGLKNWGKVIADAGIGYVADFKKIFDVDAETTKFNISNDEKCEEFKGYLDEGLALFEALEKLYSSYKLMDILGESEGEMLSACKIKEYDDYDKDLNNLRNIIFKRYFKDEFEDYFRGELYSDGSGYNKQKSKGYTRYNLCRGAKEREDFLKDVKKRLGDLSSSSIVSESDLELIKEMLGRAEEGTFLKRLKTGESGVIPYQLHLEEMNAIIEKQGKFYPFLLENKDKLNSLVTFRIPYYVGPLTQNCAAKDKDGNNRFAWSERKAGMENEKVYPWNWDEVIDKFKSAENFMNRMIGGCTYIYGEQVLPRCSLLYEEFCVLNELNGARMSQGDGEFYRFDLSTKQLILQELFEKQKTVSHAAIIKLLRENGHLTGNIRITGTQDEKKFVSKLNTYNDFCKILECEKLNREDYPMIEEIVRWCSLFEDKDILRRKIKLKYSDRLSADQIKQIIKKPYTGWGRLSKRLLDGIKTDFNNEKFSIMDILRDGNPIDSGNRDSMRVGKSMIFQEIYTNKDFGFADKVNEINREFASSSKKTVDDMQGSPALKRTVNQAIKIVDEIVSIAGKPPKNIFIEYTRDIDPKKKNKRTDTRYKTIENALNTLKKEFKDTEFSDKAYGEFKGKKQNDMNDERIVLYFMQNGKSMYSGRPLDINNLSQYQIDHIIPQCYTPDNSFDNRVLVYADENQRKLDNLLLDKGIQDKNRTWWRQLRDSKLISEKKYNNLMRTTITDKQMEGFAARQLVETNQIVKFMKEMLDERYPDTFVDYVKASISSSLRSEENLDLPKCRDINDFHHAHDAYLACRVGMFVRNLYPELYDNKIGMAHKIKSFVRECEDEWTLKHRTPGSGGFISSRFMRSVVDSDTGEIRWDIEREAARIRRVFDYKQVFISRMPEITSGKFWKATIYSPRNKSVKDSIPTKKDRPSELYGGFSSEKFAYFFSYEGIDKKGRTVYKFSAVPVSVASSVQSKGIDGLIEFAKNQAMLQGIEFTRILKDKIYKKQLIEYKGNRFFITGVKEMRNAKQLAFSLSETSLLTHLFSEDSRCDVSDPELDIEVEKIFRRAIDNSAYLSSKLNLDSMIAMIPDVLREEKVLVMKSVISIIAGKTNMINTIAFGGSKNSGNIQPTYGNILNEITFIDQSVTGMFEHKYRVCD